MAPLFLITMAVASMTTLAIPLAEHQSVALTSGGAVLQIAEDDNIKGYLQASGSSVHTHTHTQVQNSSHVPSRVLETPLRLMRRPHAFSESSLVNLTSNMVTSQTKHEFVASASTLELDAITGSNISAWSVQTSGIGYAKAGSSCFTHGSRWKMTSSSSSGNWDTSGLILDWQNEVTQATTNSNGNYIQVNCCNNILTTAPSQTYKSATEGSNTVYCVRQNSGGTCLGGTYNTGGKTFSQAASQCSSLNTGRRRRVVEGWRLCTETELQVMRDSDNSLCCGAGCSYDYTATWIGNSHVTETVTSP